jgi:hypothetical protein
MLRTFIEYETCFTILIKNNTTYGQFGTSGNCQINVNNINYHYSTQSEAIDATNKDVFFNSLVIC